jgi:hypothetical protein
MTVLVMHGGTRPFHVEGSNRKGYSRRKLREASTGGVAEAASDHGDWVGVTVLNF